MMRRSDHRKHTAGLRVQTKDAVRRNHTSAVQSDYSFKQSVHLSPRSDSSRDNCLHATRPLPPRQDPLKLQLKSYMFIELVFNISVSVQEGDFTAFLHSLPDKIRSHGATQEGAWLQRVRVSIPPSTSARLQYRSASAGGNCDLSAGVMSHCVT